MRAFFKVPGFRPNTFADQLRLTKKIDAVLAPDSTLPGSCGMVFTTASFREAMKTAVSGAGADFDSVLIQAMFESLGRNTHYWRNKIYEVSSLIPRLIT